MKFLRSIFNPSEADSAAEADPTAKAHAPTAGEPEQAIPDEGTREVAVQRDFSRGLSDLARRQMQYERYRWEPAAEIDPRGTWFVTEDVETDELVLRPGTTLEFAGRAGDGPTAPWRLRTAEGRTIELPVDAENEAGVVPAGLSRTSDREAG